MKEKLIAPAWISKKFSGWQEPGIYKAANDLVEITLTHYRGQINGQRNDGQFFFSNVTAHVKSDEMERAFVLGRAFLRFDDFLKVDAGFPPSGRLEIEL